MSRPIPPGYVRMSKLELVQRFQREEAGVLEWTERIALVPETERADAIRQAAEQLALAPDAVGQAELVIKAFLDRSVLPRSDATPDGPESVEDLSIDNDYAPGPEPQRQDVDLGPTKRDDDRRSFDEVETACRVLELAVLQDIRLRDPVQAAGLDLRLYGARLADKSLAAGLRSCADKLAAACKAAGTAPVQVEMKQTPLQKIIEKEIRLGAGIHRCNLIQRLGEEWQTLHARGSTSLSLSAYINSNVQRMEQQS